MELPINPTNQTLELLVDILEYMRESESNNRKHKTTVNGIIRGVSTIYSSANSCKKLALNRRLIREMRGRGAQRQKFYKITPTGKLFVDSANKFGVRRAFHLVTSSNNIGSQLVKEKPNSK